MAEPYPGLILAVAAPESEAKNVGTNTFHTTNSFLAFRSMTIFPSKSRA